jgi:hypothetical protein
MYRSAHLSLLAGCLGLAVLEVEASGSFAAPHVEQLGLTRQVDLAQPTASQRRDMSIHTSLLTQLSLIFSFNPAAS